MIKVGDPAPDVKLESTAGKEISLSQLRGKWVALFFYPGDFTPVCTSEVPEFNKRLADFRALDAEVFGISIDSVAVHKAWAQALGGLNYPLLSDLNKDAINTFGVERGGKAMRATFIIDPEGVVRYALVHDSRIGRNLDEILRMLQALQTGKRCPVNWAPGKKTLD